MQSAWNLNELHRQTIQWKCENARQQQKPFPFNNCRYPSRIPENKQVDGQHAKRDRRHHSNTSQRIQLFHGGAGAIRHEHLSQQKLTNGTKLRCQLNPNAVPYKIYISAYCCSGENKHSKQNHGNFTTPFLQAGDNSSNKNANDISFFHNLQQTHRNVQIPWKRQIDTKLNIKISNYLYYYK